MMSFEHPDIQALESAYEAIERNARNIIEGLTDEQGVWRPAPQSWSVAHCLDHLATANRVYLRAMEPAAAQAVQRNLRRRRPALPGLIGGWFVRTLEPPVKPRFRMTAPKKIVPRESPPLPDAAEQFFAAQR